MSGILVGMTNAPQQPPAGWYPDPAGTDAERFWDGVAWSQATRDRYEEQPPAPPQPGHGQQAYGQQGWGPQGFGQQQNQGYGYATLQPSPYAGPALPRVAGFGWRLLGFVLDNILIIIVVSFIVSAVGLNSMLSGAADRWARELVLYSEGTATGPLPMPDNELWLAILYSSLLSFVIYGIYRTVMLGTLGATLGQAALGLRTVRLGDDQAGKLSWGTAILRGFLGAFIYGIGILTIVTGITALASRNKQTLSDMASKTQVLKVR